MRTPFAVVLLVLALASADLPLAAQDGIVTRPGDQGRNVRFTLELADADASGVTARRRVGAVSVEGQAARIETGWKVAIPVTSSIQRSGQAPVTSYQYQDVGMLVSLSGRSLDNDRLRVAGRLEISALDPQHELPSSHSPQIETFSHHFEANVNDGVATILLETPKPEGGSITLVLAATLEE